MWGIPGFRRPRMVDIHDLRWNDEIAGRFDTPAASCLYSAQYHLSRRREEIGYGDTTRTS